MQESLHLIPASLQQFIREDTIVVRSPGRINLIGEHTDYNDGFVLPAAIDKAAYIALTPRTDNIIHLIAADLNDEYSVEVSKVSIAKKSWANYMLGVVAQFQKNGIDVKGFDAALTADVPIGAGLSSSAAVECATAFALNEYLHSGLDKLTMVKYSQKAEHEYAGVQCGIMDEFASMFGKAGNVIKLDCRSLDYQYEPLNIEGYKIVLLDTNVKHSLSSTEYNVRRNQCETGIRLIQEKYPNVTSLRDVNMQMLDEMLLPKDPLIHNRCKFIVEETERLINGCNDLEKNDIAAFGKKMFTTHEGLSNLYEVSCTELDFLVDCVKNNPNVLGARMMGGGFGGCTINIIKEEAIPGIIESVGAAYEKAMHKKMNAYIVTIGDGTSRLK